MNEAGGAGAVSGGAGAVSGGAGAVSGGAGLGGAAGAKPRRMPDMEALTLLGKFGVVVPRFAHAGTAPGAAAAAMNVGFPLVMKILSADIEHKSDVGGVVLGLNDAAEAEKAFRAMMRRVRYATPEARLDGALLMEQVEADREVIIGVTRDATFGPVIMFGLGGVATEVFREVSFRALPITEADAHDMIAELPRAAKLLGAFRGKPAADLGSLERLLLAVGRLLSSRPDIDQLDLNPVIASPDGAIAVDARILVRG
jgi:hypothetical protein